MRKLYTKGGDIKEKTKAYVINLDKRQDRWKQIQNKFKDLPFELERFSAINTANNGTSDDGSKKCILSHLAVIENAKKNKLPYVLILEDDCKPVDNIKDSWPLIKQWLETNLDKWDTFVGGNTYYGMHSNEKDTIKPICKLNDNLKLYFGKSYTAHFYCVNAKAYDKMLELKTNLENNNYSNISTVMNDTWPTIKNMNIVTCAPFMAIQEKGFADRGSLERNYDELFNKSESVFLSVENNINCNIKHGGNIRKQKGGKKKKTIKKKKNNKRTRRQKGGNKKKIIVRFTGGLANRVFQLFAAYGFAEKWNMDVYIINNGSKWDHVSEEESIKDIQILFPNIKIFDNSTNISKLKVMTEANIETPESDIILDGYFQNPKFFPSNPIELNLIEPQNSILKNTNINHLYFIHYRLGDYNSLTNFKLDLNNYYKFCINKILEKDNLSEFLIVSNDINQAKQIINNNLLDILKDKNIIYDDNISRLNSLYYMSKCNGGICANSSFSWMGAYSIENKNKDLIFMPYPWHNDNSRSKSDIHPEWATIVDINKI